MIEFQCHSCAQEYSVPPATAGRRTKCKKCGASLVVPEADYELLHDDEPVPPIPHQARLRPTVPGAVPVVREMEPDPEPAAYRHAENVANVVGTVNLCAGLVGVVGGLVGALWAFGQKDGGTLGVVCLVTAGGSLMSALLADLLRYVVLVVVDHARTSRAMLRN